MMAVACVLAHAPDAHSVRAFGLVLRTGLQPHSRPPGPFKGASATPPPLGLPQHAPGFARRHAMSAARSRAEGAPAAPCRAMRAARVRRVRFVACLHLLTLVAVSWTVLGPRARARGCP